MTKNRKKMIIKGFTVFTLPVSVSMIKRVRMKWTEHNKRQIF